MSACKEIREALEDIEYCLELVRKWGARNDDEIGEALSAIAHAMQKITDYDDTGRKRSKREVLGYIYKYVSVAINKERYKHQDVFFGDGDADYIENGSDSIEDLVILKTLLEDMPKHLRITIVLSMMGFTAEEIEDITDISRGRQWRVRENSKARYERLLRARGE